MSKVLAAVLVRNGQVVSVECVDLDRDSLEAFTESFNDLAGDTGTRAEIVPWSDSLESLVH